MSKKIVLEFEFEEEEVDEEYIEFRPVRVSRKYSDLSDGEIDALGESIGQTDKWQVDNWIAIQSVLGNSGRKSETLK